MSGANPNSSFGNEHKPVMYKRPSWRKTKQEAVDEKVERLFESYKIMDEVNRKQAAINGLKENERKTQNKYFPDEDDD